VSGSVEAICCATSRSLLLRAPDEELTAADDARLRAHLAHCPACAREAERSREIGQLLRRDPLPTSQVRFLPGVELARSVVEAARTRERRPSTPRWTGWAAAAIAGLATVLIVTRGVEVPPHPGPVPKATSTTAAPGFWIDDDEQTGRAVLTETPPPRSGVP
jgi:anti-sigma factor RsiW